MARPHDISKSPGSAQTKAAETTTPRSGLSSAVYGVLLCLACAAVYFPVLHAAFLSHDDNLHVYLNPHLKAITPANIAFFWRHAYEGLYVPVSYTAFALLALVAHGQPVPGVVGGASGLDPHVFHAANLAVHMANVLLAYGILRRVVHSQVGAFAGALLFGIHPLQVESVAWISEMRGLLAGLFGLLALRLHLAAGDAPRGRLSLGLESLAAASFVLALLSKPSAAAFPLIAWAIDAAILRRSPRSYAPAIALWCAVTAVILLVTRSAQPPPAEVRIPLGSRLVVAANALAFYLGKIVWPASLGLDYGQTPAAVLRQSGATMIAAGVAVIAAALIATARRLSKPATAAAVLCAGLLPVLGIVPFQYQIFSTVADRYAYLAMLGPALAVAWLAAAAASPPAEGRRAPFRAAGLAACAVGLLLCGFASSIQVLYWQDDYALFTHALAVNPQSWVAETGLGVALANAGKERDAAGHLVHATSLNPGYAQAWYNLGDVEMALGSQDEAIAAFQKALAIDPGNIGARCNLGFALQKQGRYAEAVDAYRTATRLAPGLGLAHQQLGVNLLSLHQTTEAIAELKEAIRLDPSLRVARDKLAALGAGG